MIVQLCQMKPMQQKRTCGRTASVWVRRTFKSFKGNESSMIEAACQKCVENFGGFGRIEVIEPLDQSATLAKLAAA